MRAHATAECSELVVRGLDHDPNPVDNPAFRGLHSLRLTRAAPDSVTPQGLVESKTRAGAKDGTGSRSSGRDTGGATAG